MRNDPAGVFQQYERAINRGDIDAVMSLFADNVKAAVVTNPWKGMRYDKPSDCVKAYISDTVITPHGRLKSIRIAVAGDWVYAPLELRSDLVTTRGLERIVGIDELEVRDNRIVSFRFIPDHTDPQTQSFFAQVLAAPPR